MTFIAGLTDDIPEIEDNLDSGGHFIAGHSYPVFCVSPFQPFQSNRYCPLRAISIEDGIKTIRSERLPGPESLMQRPVIPPTEGQEIQ
jgi:hypothetical protein